jgi:general stress protein CsbA
MSEKYHSSHEQGEIPKSHEVTNDSLKNKLERELTAEEEKHGSEENLEAIRRKVEKQAPIQHERPHSEKEQTKNHPVLVNKQLKDMAFSRSMTRTQKKLSAPSRAFSKVVHTPIIDTTSEFVGKTIARPSGVLTGAFISFVGTSVLLWATRYYGYTYNYLLVILLFVGGMVAGMTIEGLWHVIRRKK